MEKKTCFRYKASSVYIVTRPIQYVNILNLPDINKNDERILLLINSFSGYNDILFDQSQKHYWSDIVVLSSVYDALDWVVSFQNEVGELFLFSDYGIRIHHKLNKLRDVSIFLYEEGAATYNSSFTRFWGFHSWIFKLYDRNFLSGCYIGNYSNIKAIYVYNVDLFCALKPFCHHAVYPFQKTLFDHLNSNEDAKLFTYKEDLTPLLLDANVLLYLSGWNYDSRIERICLERPNYVKIFKPHPFLRDNKKLNEFFDKKIEGKYLAESIILSILKKAKKIVVVHHNSSSVLHFLKSDNFCDINLDASNWFQKIQLTAKHL